MKAELASSAQKISTFHSKNELPSVSSCILPMLLCEKFSGWPNEQHATLVNEKNHPSVMVLVSKNPRKSMYTRRSTAK